MAGEQVELPELPEELIMIIQSLLDAKQAVRTSVLSKLWYSAWSTIPNPILSVDAENFNCFSDFQNFARTSIKRYEKLYLKLHTFKLSLPWSDDDLTRQDFIKRLADELILSALTLSVDDLHVDLHTHIYVDHLHAHIYVHDLDVDDLHVDDFHWTGYTLPDRVFSSNLKKLCINGCIINLHWKSIVACSQLVSLKLVRVTMRDHTMRDILSGCPLLEDLRVERCYYLKKINLSAVRCNLRTFHIRGHRWNELKVEWVGNNNNAPGLQNQFQKLMSLKLSCVEVDDMFYELFSYRFPSLERLEIGGGLGPVIDIDITSNSLRYLTLKSISGLRSIRVQVLNLQNLKFESDETVESLLPSLSILTTPGECKSDLRFHQPPGKDKDVQVSWCRKIRDILTRLNLSKISIAIRLSSDAHDIRSISFYSPFVENLELEIREHGKKSFRWLMCCRPKYITWIDSTNRNSYERLALEYKELKKHENKNCTGALFCIHGIEEVDMEYYDKTLEEWRSVRQGTEEAAADAGGKFRVRIKWC